MALAVGQAAGRKVRYVAAAERWGKARSVLAAAWVPRVAGAPPSAAGRGEAAAAGVSLGRLLVTFDDLYPDYGEL